MRLDSLRNLAGGTRLQLRGTLDRNAGQDLPSGMLGKWTWPAAFGKACTCKIHDEAIPKGWTGRICVMAFSIVIMMPFHE